MPRELLPKLKLKLEQLLSIPPVSLMTLAEQLIDVERRTEAAGVAVTAAMIYDSRSEITDAQKAYIRAYRMDQTNDDASRGAIELCAATVRRCDELEMKNRDLEQEIQRRTWTYESVVSIEEECATSISIKFMSGVLWSNLIFPSDMTILQLKNEILQRVAKLRDPATVSPAGSSKIRIICGGKVLEEDTQVGTLVAPEGSSDYELGRSDSELGVLT